MVLLSAVIAGFASLAAASPTPSSFTPEERFAHLEARRLLGSSFGVPGDNAAYDYIVVGGGNAGLTIATRLAEQQKGTVAVIEAGSFYEITNGNISQIPAYDGAFASKGAHDWHPGIDWGYVTAPQTSAQNSEMHYPRGKCLGGSSARNYMLYHRGTKASYKMWADAVGDNSYRFEAFLPYFERSLKFTPPNMSLRFQNSTPTYDLTVMGNGRGPLSVTFSNYAQAFASWTQRGLKALGMDVINNFQSGSLLGQSMGMFTIDAKTMTRDSSATSFLKKALDYPNYIVYPSTLAKKVVFDSNKKATGVVVDTQGFQYTLSARREVILSGGVFGSPQLLQASGVGPAPLLRSLGIPVVKDLPGVGQNMEDHVYVGPSYRVNGVTMSSLSNAAFAAKAAEEYNRQASGIFANPTTDTVGWEKIPEPIRSSTMSNATRQKLAAYPADWPEMEYVGLSAYLGYMNKSRDGDPNDGYNYASLAAVLCTPRSRGSVNITSPDTAVHPRIDPNFFSDRADIEVLIAAYKRVRQFWNSTAVSPFVIGQEAFPGLQVQTDAQIEDIILKSFNTIYHGACTAKMGKSSDPMAVVDSKARVYGVTGLRVVDASSFAVLPPGHPMATVYALAEKISCDITGGC